VVTEQTLKKMYLVIDIFSFYICFYIPATLCWI